MRMRKRADTALLVTVVCAHQSFQPMTCCVETDGFKLAPDGRACTIPQDCFEGAPVPGADYACERPGLFGTTSIARGRVRFTGKLADPNECALAIGAGTPFLFALVDRKKTPLRIARELLAALDKRGM